MSESKVVSVRIPQELLDAIDQIAAVQYPPRGNGEPNRSQVLLDAIESYIRQPVDDVNKVSTVSTIIDEERVKGIVDKRIQSLREELIPVLGESSA